MCDFSVSLTALPTGRQAPGRSVLITQGLIIRGFSGTKDTSVWF